MTALHWAAYNDDAELSRRCSLGAGANLEAATRNGALTPLLVAATQRQRGVIDLLLQAGARPTRASWTGDGPDDGGGGWAAPSAVQPLLDARCRR